MPPSRRHPRPTWPPPGGVRTSAVAAAVALALAGLTAGCAPGPGRAGSPHGLPSLDEAESALREHGASGPAVAVWRWTSGFVAGDPGAEPLVHTREWIAPLGPASAPTGTVTVWQDPAGDGGLERAAVSDHADLGAALATVGPADVLVTDESAWLVVTQDTVRPLVPLPPGGLDGPVGLTEYRRVLAARDAGHAADDGPGSDSVGG